jgi:hypothetical protein
MAEYKSKPARIADKLRKMIKWPAGSSTLGPFGSGGTDSTGTTSPLGADSAVPYKKKPARKGRPD